MCNSEPASSSLSQFVEKKIRHGPEQNLGCCAVLHRDKPGQNSFFSDWLSRLKPTALYTADVHMVRERDTEWRRQRDVASVSRLSHDWFAVFSEHVWVWLMYIHTRSRQKTSRLPDLFSFYYRLQTFVRNSNFALVHSQVHICLCGRAALRIVGFSLHQTVTPSTLLTPWPLTFIERITRQGR